MLCNSFSVSISFNSSDLELCRFKLNQMGDFWQDWIWEEKPQWPNIAPTAPNSLANLWYPLLACGWRQLSNVSKAPILGWWKRDMRWWWIVLVVGSVRKAVKEKLSLMMKRLLGPTSTSTTSAPPLSPLTEMTVYNHLTLQNSFNFTLSSLWFAFYLLRSRYQSPQTKVTRMQFPRR